jgi:hypothetical protein
MSGPSRIPLATYDIGWRETVEVARHFGRRHDPEPAQPLIRVAFELGEDAIRTEYWLSRSEALALAAALRAACGQATEMPA